MSDKYFFRNLAEYFSNLTPSHIVVSLVLTLIGLFCIGWIITPKRKSSEEREEDASRAEKYKNFGKTD